MTRQSNYGRGTVSPFDLVGLRSCSHQNNLGIQNLCPPAIKGTGLNYSVITDLS